MDDDVIFGKGVFPYSYFDHEDRLTDTSLPPLDMFFDTLTNSLRTLEEDRQRGMRACRQFGRANLRDYLRAYLQLDCILLADIFENFRKTTWENYTLDPANFVTLPQLSFAAAFKEIRTDLLTEVEMYQFFEAGIRGGMTFVNKHMVQARNPECGDAVDPREATYISYWDENNLYGNALCQPLPTSSTLARRNERLPTGS